MKQTITITLIAGAALGLGACAVGRGPAGEIVVGPKIGELVETSNELARGALSEIAGPWGNLLLAGLGTTGVGGLLAAVLKVGQAKAEAAAARARADGEAKGWNDALNPRENVALTLPQLAQPVFVGASGGAAGPVPAVPVNSAGAGASAAPAASPVVAPVASAGGADWPASASLPVAQG